MTKEKRTPYTDPVTGDPLTAGEKFSWVMQAIIRRWAFIGVITVITIVVWSLNIAVGLTWWNLGASYLALLIESTVGIAMFSQTRRDAVIIRHLRDVIDTQAAVGEQRARADEKRDAMFELVQRMEAEHGEMIVDIQALLIQVHGATVKPRKR